MPTSPDLMFQPSFSSIDATNARLDRTRVPGSPAGPPTLRDALRTTARGVPPSPYGYSADKRIVKNNNILGAMAVCRVLWVEDAIATPAERVAARGGAR